MSKQRIVVLVVSVVGIIAAFLPWVTIVVFGVNVSTSGIEGDGVFTLILFAVATIMCFIGQRAKPLGKTKFVCAGAGAMSVVVAGLSINEFSGVGLFLTILAGVVLCVVSFVTLEKR